MTPNEVISCAVTPVAPFFVTHHGKLYGQGKQKCTPTTPDECRTQVALRKESPYGGYYAVAVYDTKWGSCLNKTYPVSYTCAAWDSHVWDTEVTISSLLDGVPESDISVSKNATLGCV